MSAMFSSRDPIRVAHTGPAAATATPTHHFVDPRRPGRHSDQRNRIHAVFVLKGKAMSTVLVD